MDIMTNKNFPNPIIAEALCEIHFETQKWDKTFGSLFFKKIESEFPTFESVSETPMIILGPVGIQQSPAPPMHRLRYKHANQNLMLQLSENVFTFNQLKEYPGWFTLKEKLIENWNRLVEVTQINKVNRIGLRYINKIPREQPNQLAGEWLKENEYIAACVLKSINGFVSRVETKIRENERAIITLVPSDDNHIIFDIDCICEGKIEANNIGAELESLHQRVWDVFSKSLTEKLKKHMSEK